MVFNRYWISLLGVALTGAACTDGDDAVSTPTTSTTASELDVIALAERPASLLVVDTPDAAARRRFERTLETMGGGVLATLPPRLVVAQVPDGADAALADVGLVARFDRAVNEADLAGATPAEARFLAVYTNRWQSTVPPKERIATLRAVEQAAEGAPLFGPGIAPGEPHGDEEPRPTPDPEDGVSIPYASGTVVVSVILPESNGAIDASTEDWNEERVREAYLKVQGALDTIAQAEPNADLRFILHYESAPAAGGLEGTVDSDYEFGKRAPWGDWENENLATSHLLQRILGHEVDPTNPWPAANEYQLSLRQRYEADAAYFVIVAANHNGTAGLRAHAWINGPWTVLDSWNGYEVFTHEFGHIFGALDEYCPDACQSPTSLQGYLGIYNANAQYQAGDVPGGGINGGFGESASSLMQYNMTGAINGYTRAAWGWLDLDGDGVIEVRDTAPKSDLVATAEGQTVRIAGMVTDRPQMPLWRTPYSMNRIVGLEIELEKDGAIVDVLELDLPGNVRGRQPVDLTIPALPAGVWNLHVRAKNDAGNLEQAAVVLPVTIVGAADTAPIPHLDLPGSYLGSDTASAIHAEAIDLEGGAAQVRVDLGADGTWDTAWTAAADLDVTAPAGVYAIVVAARDAAGNTSERRWEIPVFDGNAPPEVALAPLPSLVHATALAELDVAATARDADEVQYAFAATLATDDGAFDAGTKLGPDATARFALPTPEKLNTHRLDLSGGDPMLSRAPIRDVLVLDQNHVAVAAGTDGVWFVDITDRARPVVTAHLALETTATHLFKKGRYLYVLGTMLTVVDLQNAAAPVEIKQLLATTGSRTASAADAVAIPEAEWAAQQYLMASDGERITDVKVKVQVDHAQPAQLRIVLTPPKQSGLGPIVLRDHVAGPGGLRTYQFNGGNTPALRDLAGTFVAEYWTIEVYDDVADGVTGTLVASEIRFSTKSRAAKTLANPARIAGVLPGGELVVAGAGVQALDVTFPQWITSEATVSGYGSYDAVLVGDRAVVAAAPESKEGGDVVLKGLSVVDFSIPWWPEVVRVEDDLGAAPDHLAKVGNRLYMHMVNYVCTNDECERTDYTSIANANKLANGAANWELGQSPLRVERHAFGNNQAIWTIGAEGTVQQYDVTDPANLTVLKAYPQSWGASLLPIGTAGEILLFQWGIEAQIGNLTDVVSTLSRVYRVSVEARDAGGRAGRAYRTVHVVPYDHVPAIGSVEVFDGTNVRVHVTDPDAGTIWDPTLLVRADWDSDGAFDTDWFYVQNQPGAVAEFWGMVGSGTHTATFEVRDGFWATSRFVANVTIP